MENYRLNRLQKFVFIILFFPFALLAQEKNNLDSLFLLPEVTVRAIRMPKQLMAPLPTQVLSAQEISKFGIQSVADAAKRFTGTTVRDYGGIGGIKTVSVRSLGAHHTAVEYDGVVVSNCQAGQIDIGRFNIDNVASLTLFIGHSDELLQTARKYASAGVLSITNKTPLFKEQQKNDFQVQLKLGSFGEVNPVLYYARKLSNNDLFFFNFNYLRADGQYPYQLQNGDEIVKDKRRNSDIQSFHFEGNYQHKFSTQQRIDFKAYYFNSKRGLPGSIILYNPDSSERLWDENFFIQSLYKNKISDKLRIQSVAKFNYSWNKYEDTDVKYENGKQTDLNTQREYYFSSSAVYQPLKTFSFSLAWDGALNNLTSNLPHNPSPSRYTSLTALSMKFKQERFTAFGTLLHTFATEKVESGDKPSPMKKLTPSLSLSYKLLNDKSLNLRFFYKHTFRMPSFNDLYYYRLGNTQLSPELAKEFNLGLTWNNSKIPFLEFLSCSVDAYYNQVTDKIVAIPSTYVWKMLNYGEVKITGIDANLDSEFYLMNDISANIHLGYTYQEAIDLTDETSKSYKNQLPYTPKHNFNVSLAFDFPWFNCGYNMMYVGNRYSGSQNIRANKIKAYAEHNITFSREFDFKTSSLKVMAECVNLTDKQYEVIKFYPMPGRSFKLTLIYKY